MLIFKSYGKTTMSFVHVFEIPSSRISFEEKTSSRLLAKDLQIADCELNIFTETGLVQVTDRIRLTTNFCESSNNVHYFDVNDMLVYNSFCLDFGPVGLDIVLQFCDLLDEKLRKYDGELIATRVSSDSKSFTNAVFLLGSFLVVKMNNHPDAVWEKFQAHRLETFRDVSPGPQTFHLQVRDCWSGLFRAKSISWVDANLFDPIEYAVYGSHMNGGLHHVVPGKLVAMRSPMDVPGGAEWADITTGDGRVTDRVFSPAHYGPILRRFGVQAVVRLNGPAYDPDGFAPYGIAVADLPFPDGSTPPPDVVGKFLAIVEGLPGAVAVHCRAGLGRTGTLIALYIMKHHGFTAREAMGWLRIVRPGSVIGAQQQYLCDKEPLMRRAGGARPPAVVPGSGSAPPRVPPPSPRASAAAGAAGAAAVGRFVASAVGEVDARVRAVEDRVREMQRAGRIPPPTAARDGLGGAARRGSCPSIVGLERSAPPRAEMLRAAVERAGT